MWLRILADKLAYYLYYIDKCKEKASKLIEAIKSNDIDNIIREYTSFTTYNNELKHLLNEIVYYYTEFLTDMIERKNRR